MIENIRMKNISEEIESTEHKNYSHGHKFIIGCGINLYEVSFIKEEVCNNVHAEFKKIKTIS